MSLFAVDIDSTADLINSIEYFFRPPKRDLHENPKNSNATNPSDNCDNEENSDANHTWNIISGF